MKKKTCCCVVCGKKIESKDGRQFCSIACVQKFNEVVKPAYKITCRFCGTPFLSHTKNVKFCSLQCKDTFTARKRRLDPKLVCRLKVLPCEVCGWAECTRDLHHIIPVSLGGANTEANLITLCPNCHRKVHSKIILIEVLEEAIKNRK